MVKVIHSNNIIPLITNISSIDKSNTKLDYPKNCPTCGHLTKVMGPLLTCPNPLCDSRVLGDLYKWSDKVKSYFKVAGLGPERISDMFELKLINTPYDLYKLSVHDLTDVMIGVKMKSAKNILAFQKHTEFPLDLFLSALNIPNVGESIFSLIVEDGYETIESVLEADVEDFSSINGIGPTRAKVIVKTLKKKDKLISNLLKYITIVSNKKELASDIFAGKTFCFTGSLAKSRSHYEDIVKSNGGSIKGISASLGYLVAGEKAGSKLAKAEKASVKILNETEFLNMLKE